MENETYIRAYEYQKNVNPYMKPIKTKSINHDDFDFTEQLNFIDFSEYYDTNYKLTSPNLLACFIKIKENDNLLYNKNFDYSIDNKLINHLDFNACSNIFYVIQGKLTIHYLINNSNNTNKNSFTAERGDIVVLPHFIELNLMSESEKCSIFYLNDSPLLNYLGVKANENTPKFKPCIYDKKFLEENLDLLSDNNNNRKGILLGNNDTEDLGIKTITHTLWALYNELPPLTKQKVHKHNSIAIDLCIFSPDEKKVYTLVGDNLDENNDIINPEIYYWKSGSIFITCPGKWHSHHNETNEGAYVLPVQDAGLLLYQRILGITLK